MHDEGTKENILIENDLLTSFSHNESQIQD